MWTDELTQHLTKTKQNKTKQNKTKQKTTHGKPVFVPFKGVK